MKFKVILLLILAIVLISGCYPDASFNQPVTQDKPTDEMYEVDCPYSNITVSCLTNSTDCCPCNYFYVKDNIAITDDVTELMDKFDLRNIAVVMEGRREICPLELNEFQKECVIGYMSTYPVGDIIILELHKDSLYSEYSTIIDCENKCWSYQQRKGLIEGNHEVGKEKFEYKTKTLCWK